MFVKTLEINQEYYTLPNEKSPYLIGHRVHATIIMCKTKIGSHSHKMVGDYNTRQPNESLLSYESSVLSVL